MEQFYENGTYIAVRSVEEQFFVALCLENSSTNNKFKIKWLDRVGTSKTGTKFSLSYMDEINIQTVIGAVDIRKISRFRYLLSVEEEKRILSILNEDFDTDVEVENNSALQSEIISSKPPIKECQVILNPTVTENFDKDSRIKNNNKEGSNCSSDSEIVSSEPPTKECEVDIHDILSERFNKDSEMDNVCSLESEISPGPLTKDNIMNNAEDSVTVPEEVIMQVMNEDFDKIDEIANQNVLETSFSLDERSISSVPFINKSKVNIYEVITEELINQNNFEESTLSTSETENPPIAKDCNIQSEIEHSIDKMQTNSFLEGVPDVSETSRNHCEINILSNVEISTLADDNFKESTNTYDNTTLLSDISKECNLICEVEKTVSLKGELKSLESAIIPSTPTPPFMSSGSEYIPETDVSESDREIPLRKIITYKIPENTGTNISESSSDESETADIQIRSSRKTITGNRIYDKKHCCYFCYKFVCKVTRHLTAVHANEFEIARLLAMEEKSIERKVGFLCILRAGDYYHNNEVLCTQRGEFILSRRPNTNDKRSSNYRKYGPCPNCLGFFLLTNLWHHVKHNCPKKCTLTKTTKGFVSRRDLRGESLALVGHHTDTSVDFRKYILANFKNDKISEVCNKDEIIIKFGSMLFEKYTTHQHEHVRQSMRQLGRLVLEIQQINSEFQNLSQIMLPQNFDTLIKGVQMLCIGQKNEIQAQSYGIPSLALKLGHSLRKCALIVRGMALRKGDLKLNRQMESFLDLMTLEWNVKVSTAALRTLRDKKMNSTQLLPITDDIMKLNKLLDIVIKELTSDQNLFLSPPKWAKLAQATLSRIVLFNKRRSGEAARMTLQQYAVRPNWSEQCTSELKASLTPLEQSLASNLTVVEVPGKSRKNYKVPILLTQDMKNAIDKLIETRDAVGIARNNVYIFARSGGSTRNLRGHDCLRKFANEAELEQPLLITSTKLRKYIATVVQVFNLRDNEYDWLARHLGHDIRIHREFYRLHESAVELTKISRILLALDKGEVNKFKGKSLDEINVAELSDIDCNDESDGDNNSDNDENSNEEDDMISVGQIHQNDEIQATSSAEKEKKNRSTSKTVKTSQTKPVRRTWSQEEKDVLLKFFRNSIRNETVPNKHDSLRCISENQDILKNRSWRDVKNWIYNQIKSIRNKRQRK